MNWYDGCLGWVPTVERIHTMQFSLPYLKQPYSFFYVTKGKESQFNPKDITGKNIGKYLHELIVWNLYWNIIYISIFTLVVLSEVSLYIVNFIRSFSM